MTTESFQAEYVREHARANRLEIEVAELLKTRDALRAELAARDQQLEAERAEAGARIGRAVNDRRVIEGLSTQLHIATDLDLIADLRTRLAALGYGHGPEVPPEQFADHVETIIQYLMSVRDSHIQTMLSLDQGIAARDVEIRELLEDQLQSKKKIAQLENDGPRKIWLANMAALLGVVIKDLPEHEALASIHSTLAARLAPKDHRCTFVVLDCGCHDRCVGCLLVRTNETGKRHNIHGLTVHTEACPDPKHCACECLECKRSWEAAGRPVPHCDRPLTHTIVARLVENYAGPALELESLIENLQPRQTP